MCNCADCKVAAEKLKSCRANNPQRVPRKADGLQSSDNNPQGADTPSENTSADRAARWKQAESKAGLRTARHAQVVSLPRSHTCVWRLSPAY